MRILIRTLSLTILLALLTGSIHVTTADAATPTTDSCGWSWSNPQPQPLHSVWGSSGSDIYAVGDSGTILHYDGNTWGTVLHGLTTTNLNGIWGSSGSDVYAVGNSGTILHYNGNTWSTVLHDLIDVELFDVWGSASNDIYTVGENGTILHYDGGSWSRIHHGLTAYGLIAVWGSSNNDVYAIGGSDTILHYDGSGWRSIEHNLTVYGLDGLWGSSSNDVYAVGRNSTMVHFDGRSWHNFYHWLRTERLSDVWGSSSDVYAVAQSGTILHYSCTGRVIVEKQTIPDGDLSAFHFLGVPAGTVSDGGQLSSQVLPGNHESTENVPPGWTLTDITCDDDDSAGDVDNRTATFNVAAGETVTCMFTNTKKQTLLMTKGGMGGGTVTSSPSGIYCGPSCAFAYNHGTTVTLTTTPFAGSEFSGWSGDCDSNGTVTMDADKSCNANFTLEPQTLLITRGGMGDGMVTSSPPGVSCGSSCEATYDNGTIVRLTANAYEGSTFREWSGDCDASGTVTMDANKTCNAYFDLKPQTLTVQRDGTGNGKVTSSPSGIDCGSECAYNFENGTLVTLTAIEFAESEFNGWRGDCDSSGTTAMDANRICTAIFTLKAIEQETLTVGKEGTGSGTVTSEPSGIACGATCSSDYDFGTTVTLTAAPSAESEFSGWRGDCDATGSVEMQAARSCTAIFTLKQYTLTVNKKGTGSGTITSNPPRINCGTECTYVFGYGTVVTLTASADADSAFVGWGGDSDATGAVTMDADSTCIATFNAVIEPEYTLFLPMVNHE